MMQWAAGLEPLQSQLYLLTLLVSYKQYVRRLLCSVSKLKIALQSQSTHRCLTCKKEQDISFWFSEMDLHDGDQGCIHVVTLRCFGIQNLYRKGAPRDPVLRRKAICMMSRLLDNISDLPPFASFTICYSSIMTEQALLQGRRSKMQHRGQGLPAQ